MVVQEVDSARRDSSTMRLEVQLRARSSRMASTSCRRLIDLRFRELTTIGFNALIEFTRDRAHRAGGRPIEDVRRSCSSNSLTWSDWRRRIMPNLSRANPELPSRQRELLINSLSYMRPDRIVIGATVARWLKKRMRRRCRAIEHRRHGEDR